MYIYLHNKLIHPCTILISGPTGSGKTELVLKLLARRWFTEPINRVYCLYSEWQPAYRILQFLHPDTIFNQTFDEQQ
jgi:hypothetical protein